MRDLLKENIGSVEMGFRFLLGAALIAATLFGDEVFVGEMFNGEMLVWMALFSVYPVVTAFMSWDPVYAIAHGIALKAKEAFPHKPTALPVS